MNIVGCRLNIKDVKFSKFNNIFLKSMVKNQKKYKINTKLIKYLMNNEELSGDEIVKIMYPDDNFNIFISHSSKDYSKVIKIAELIKYATSQNGNKGLNSFVDEDVWGNSYNLLDRLNESALIDCDEMIYDYDATNLNAAKVFVMLSNALITMINKCKYFLFIESEESLNSQNSTTRSPWIYLELNAFHVKHSLGGMITESKERLAARKIESANINFQAIVNDLKKISIEDFIEIIKYQEKI